MNNFPERELILKKYFEQARVQNLSQKDFDFWIDNLNEPARTKINNIGLKELLENKDSHRYRQYHNDFTLFILESEGIMLNDHLKKYFTDEEYKKYRPIRNNDDEIKNRLRIEKIANTYYRQLNSNELTINDFNLWLESIEEPRKSKCKNFGLDYCRSFLDFQRFILECRDKGMDEFLKSKLSDEDYTIFLKLHWRDIKDEDEVEDEDEVDNPENAGF